MRQHTGIVHYSDDAAEGSLFGYGNEACGHKQLSVASTGMLGLYVPDQD